MKNNLFAIQLHEIYPIKTSLTLLITADWVILATGVRPRKAIVESYYAAFENINVLDDALKCGGVLDATQEAHTAASAFQPK